LLSDSAANQEKDLAGWREVFLVCGYALVLVLDGQSVEVYV